MIKLYFLKYYRSMKNWAGNVRWHPHHFKAPSTEAEIQAVVHRAIEEQKQIRLIGTGHSFTPVCETKGVSVTLDNYQGLISVDKEKYQATIKAGTKLNLLGELLYAQGLAMENMGDIDVQSIAGTISTGTHGTGKHFGSISTQVVGLKFINGKGEIVQCSETKNKALFKAAQVSLGLLGIITEVTLQCIPSYKLKIENKKEKLQDVLNTWDERNSSNRNFEYYWLPYTDTAWTKTSNTVDADEPDKTGLINYWSEYVLENYAFGALCNLAAKMPSLNERVSKISAATISNTSKIHNSHKIYATQRLVKFREMEYNVPNTVYQDVMKEVVRLVNSKKFNIHFPIENRIVKADDIYMSPAYGRESAYIACHVYHKKDHKPYFDALESIFRAYDGRPHWGKMNSLKTKDVEDLYPAFSKFTQHRKEQDPDGIFMSPYMQTLME